MIPLLSIFECKAVMNNFKILKMKYFGIFLFLFFVNCKKEHQETVLAKNESDSVIIENPETKKDSSVTSIEKVDSEPKIYDSEFLPPEKVLINNHNYLLPKKQFDQIYPKLDSTRTAIWECGDPFEWLDVDWMTKTYGPKSKTSYEYENYDGYITSLYSKKIYFLTNKNKVLFFEMKMTGNNFKVKEHDIILTEATTKSEFEKMFPKANKWDESDTYVMQLDNVYDAQFVFIFKNGKLDDIHLWWLLC